ncbi:MAG: glycoside hydrolase [Tannerella sp.]|jgi:Neuraminidase (sialidase)|nr:glycoside hydrolase [Tannerella sp.]
MRQFLFLCTVLAMSVFTVTSQENESIRKITLQLTPGDDNPRNSEGDFVTLKDGRIMFIYTHFTGKSTSDYAPAHLAARYSSDGGKTWTQNDKLVLENEGGMNIMSVSLLRLNNGKIALFYAQKNSETDCIPIIRISSDDGETWGEQTACITDKKGYFVLNNSRVIQLKSGRILMAVALHQEPEQKWQNKGALFVYYSDDMGRTWTSSPKVPDNTDIITQEPGLVKLKDGRIMMFIRASGGVQQLSYSSDDGETWSHIEPSNLHSPLSPASIKRIPSTKDLLAVWNNNDGSNPSIKGKRTPLTVAVSKDEGKTWLHVNDIETDPDEWYCYIAIHFDRKNVLLGYCAGKTHLALTNISLIPVKKLYGKK